MLLSAFADVFRLDCIYCVLQAAEKQLVPMKQACFIEQPDGYGTISMHCLANSSHASLNTIAINAENLM